MQSKETGIFRGKYQADPIKSSVSRPTRKEGYYLRTFDRGKEKSGDGFSSRGPLPGELPCATPSGT